LQLAVNASRAPWAQILPIFDPDDTFLTYHVRRSNIVDDPYENVMRTTESKCKVHFCFPYQHSILDNVAKPLRVIFAGEDAEDRGGVRKEFFLLLFQEMLQPTYGMFTEDHESHFIWFTGVVEELVSYEVIGFLCALAIHNFVLINLPFPLALYKKILKQPITLEDFTELHPSEGHSLERLLEYEGDDVEEVFCLDFSINMDVFGHSKQIDLIENGSNTPVTQKNRAKFVELYIERKMELGANGIIKDQLSAFIRGFSRVLNSDVLNLFQPRELMEMIIGRF
jgi:E3 ubiquitin-protein ligase HERC4